ncbi:Dinitrogenase iron-molybdenum cofactor biosynthesis protein [Methanocaldococcus sp. FS406-22]|uniref:NifB/NifX family molybdenum-iron cluster-binding protein n=1 Tax=Methanocaldococcus sp. (strain FS406-22) TaxID=644281 RepID=UPI0001BF3546|nr:NifB/NifX family molybdenum-iron cluster-binding protein [Methanocaldococcus sp. FS406-22]ADC70230.1 Dinitrogenase iron-molybdenum cofactor biosynthesis protein [Methanocaldococcus sp. FS406-22]
MKIALPIENNQLSPHFGRCEKFMIVEIENGEIKNKEIIENTAREGMHGVGTTSASLIANMGVNAIIVQNIGPKAYSVFKQLGIEVYKSNTTSIDECIKLFLEGKLEKFE